ncbi:helix-turn-helix domain-containing protein [Muricomes sp. OA1]|uniref:helix-turn-helix domain-containing protein n=1 Tax=Lachnospiraceae TaxID=186803 RepID=UPI001F0681A0|nr:helix-turn-helix transcriptional regulator [Muricomes sp. OA1]MCH1973544.1 helix-turn-helix domain-containing protein [Muricomes sp. OA1]
MADIGFSIRKLRTQKHMTQQQLARFLFITRATLSNYERGKRLPDIYMIKRIADIFEISIDSFFGG